MTTPKLDTAFHMEHLVPARNAIGGRPYWTRLMDDKGDMLWQARIDEGDRIRRDLATARRAIGWNNVRLLRIDRYDETSEYVT